MSVDTDESPRVTRRGIGRKIGLSALASQGIVSVARGATDSGYVEAETVATLPSNTSITVTVYEDTTGGGTAENITQFPVSDGTNTEVLDSLEAIEDSGAVYWLEVEMSTSDDTVTPELDSVTITLPEDPPPGGTPAPSTPAGPREKKDPGQIWDSFLVFVSVITMAAAGIAGLGSRSMAVGSVAAYTVFAYIAIQTGHALLTNILYVTLVIVIIGMAFKMWRTEFGGEV